MRTSEQINEIAEALASAQGEVRNPSYNRVNPHFKSKYADLGEVLSVVRPALSKYGIALMQMTDVTDTGIVLHTRLTHSSGQWIEGVYPVSPMGTHQQMGAALTYAKRQALSAIVGVAGEDDTDGEDTKDIDTKGVKPKVSAKPVPANQAVNKLNPKDSTEMLDIMVKELGQCASKQDLQTWAVNWRDVKPQLIDEHQWKITDLWNKTQAEINAAANGSGAA
jgi:hypothetical protein